MRLIPCIKRIRSSGKALHRSRRRIRVASRSVAGDRKGVELPHSVPAPQERQS